MQKEILARISRDEIAGIMDILYKLTGLPVCLTDTEGQTLMSTGEEKRFCTLLHQRVFSPAVCSELYRSAGQCAQRLGEAYIYSCPGNLYHITYPLTVRGKLLGSVRIGPFLMDAPESTLLEGVMERFPFSPTLALDLYDELSQIAILQPERVTNLGKLLGCLFSHVLPAEQEDLAWEEQTDMPEKLYERERAVLQAMRALDLTQAREELGKWMVAALSCAEEQPETVRLRATELAVLFSRVSLESGADAKSVYALCNRELPRLEAQQNFRAMGEDLDGLLERFLELALSGRDKGNVHIRQALRCISRNLAQPLTVMDVAQKLNLSPGYFASLFREVVGESFHTYLMRMRVEESKRLLLSTQDSLTEIALKLGFTDQSYFCRVFRKFMGMTPGKYRSGKVGKETEAELCLEERELT